MPKAERKNTTSKKSSVSPDPVFAAIENHQKLDHESIVLFNYLRDKEGEAIQKHGQRPLPQVSWRNHCIDDSEIDSLKNELLGVSGADPQKIEAEYWEAKARLLGTELAAEQWDKCAGLTAIRRAHDRAKSAGRRAARQMARTQPRTPAGIAALLDYVITGLLLLTRGEADWHEAAFSTIMKTLAAMETPRSLGAADSLAAVRTEKARLQKAA